MQHKSVQARRGSISSSDVEGVVPSGDSNASDESDVEKVLAKENNASVVPAAKSCPKGKSKAVMPTRKPMRSRPNGTAPAIEKPTDQTSDEDDGIDAIQSPRRRRKPRGKVLRPTVISLSSSSSSCSSQVDDEKDETERHGYVDELARRMHSGLEITSAGHESDAIVASLLASCDQSMPQGFDKCLDDIERQAKASRWSKIGEATYSEVFSIQGSDMVLKVIPLMASSEDTKAELLERSQPCDVLREMQLTSSLSSTGNTFVKLHRASVVRGKYPERLLRAWDARRREKKDQNTRPDAFDETQLFGLLLLSDGGKDLESLSFASWTKAASVFCQVTQALATAEQECEFEHRDLHWGNVVIKDVEQERHAKTSLLSFSWLTSPRRAGVQATIIDFTLSRARLQGRVTAHPFDDEAFFCGSGDIQFDVYRQMKTLTDGDWQGFHPRTNVLWLRYLLAKILDDKALAKPEHHVQEAGGGQDIDSACLELLTMTRNVLDQDMDAEPGCTILHDAASLADLLSSTLSMHDEPA